jgi:hypothetical protein
MALITPGYAKQQQHLHDTTEYGTAAIAYAPLVAQIIDKLQISHLLDYGCGSRTSLARAMFDRGSTARPKLEHIQPGHKFQYQAYDAGVERFSAAPIPAQMVTCIDVLEHVEPDCLDEVLDHLKSLTEAVLFCTVHTGPAAKVLPDGRNAHINQQPMSYWLPKLWDRFELHTVQVTGDHQFHVIAYAKPHAIEHVNGSRIS